MFDFRESTAQCIELLMIFQRRKKNTVKVLHKLNNWLIKMISRLLLSR